MQGTEELRILVVDDEPAIVQLMTVILASSGYIPLSATSGAQGLALLNDIPATDLIVLDLSMPEIDGRAFFRRARQSGYRGPIIICSAYGAEAARCELGASAAITKPFDPLDLLSSIENLTPVGR